MGGYERFASRLAGDLSRVGIIADQVTTASGFSRTAYVLTRLGMHRQPPIFGEVETPWRDARARLRSADCIYVKNDPIDLLVAFALARNRPFVVGMHSSLDIPRVDWATGVRRWARRSWIYRKLLIGNRRLYHCLYPPPKHWNLPSARVRVVPNPVEPKQRARRHHSKEQRFLFVGRLNRDKGADLLPGLAGRLLTEPDTDLVIVGDGEYASTLKGHPGLHYYSYRADIRDLMRQATWLVMPSRWEQQPLVLLEALEEGLPYILGPAPEIRELGLDDTLVMTAGTVDAFHLCCLEAIRRGRSEPEYASVTRKVGELADAWPRPRQTLAAMASMLTEAARFSQH